MRKIFTLLTLVLVCNGLYAQIWQSQNFNSCALPAGWTENILSGTQGWLFVDQSPDAFNVGNIDGTCMLLFDDDWLGSAAAPSSVELIGPAVDLSGLPSVLMEFDYNLQEYGPAAGDGFTVDVWDGSAWVNVFSRLDVNDCGAWSCGPPYPHAVVDVTAYANPAFQVRISYFDGGGWSWYFGFDNYVLFTPPANDVGVSAVLQPIEGGCSAGPAEPVEVTISNYGSADASGFDVCFIVDGPTGLSTVCENVGALTITPGASSNFLFSGTADLSLPGIYSVTGYTAMVGDGIPENDSSTIGFNLSVITPTYTENFNSYADGATVFLDFINETYDQRQWEVNIGTTLSAGTGPSSGAGGSGGYIYIESSGSIVGDSAVLSSRCIDLSGLTVPVFEFAYHMFGPAIDYIRVEAVDGAGVATEIYSLVGQQQFASADPWLNAVADLSPWAGSIIQLRITGKIKLGSDGFTFTADMALDNFVIREISGDDLGVTAIFSPIAEGCFGGTAENINVEISNFGSVDQSAFDVCYELDGPSGIFSACENVGALTVTAISGTATYTFASTVDLSVPGLYDLLVYTSLPTDGDNSNDSLNTTVELLGALSTFPYVEDFNSYADGATVFLDFTNETYDQRQWEVNIGTTSSAGTGPSSGAGGSGGYIYIESSGAIAGDSAVLSSQCLDLSGLSAPVFEFAYHMFGPAIDYIRVEVIDGSGVATEIYMLVGQQQFANADPWLNAIADLSPWVGSIIQLRITGKIKLGSDGFTFTADMALDNFVIREISGDDLGVTAIFSPVAGGCFGGATESINVQISNFGSADQSAFDVCYELDGPSGIFSACENVGALTVTAISGTATFTFASTVDLSLPGLYDLLVYTSLPTDGDNSNDSLSATVELFGALSTFPYLETFDSYANCGDALFACALNGSCASSVSGGWEQELSDNMDWSITNLTSTPSAGTGPTSGDHTSGFGRYLFTESSGCLLQRAGLISPCFDLDALTCPEVSFWYHMLGTNQGTMTLDIDTGTGVWLNLWSISGNQGSEWLETRVPLADYIGMVVRFRISGLTGSGFLSDMAIDDFSISDKSEDVGVISVDSPASGCEVGVSDVTVTLVNGSCVTAPAFDVVLEIDGISIVTDTYPAGLAGLSTVSHTFSVPFDFETPGSYAITAYTILAGDLYPENDEAESIVASLAPPAVNTGFEASYCLSEDNIFPAPLYPGGTWSGTGIVDPSTGELDPSLVGAGNSTDITYTFVPTGSYSVAEIPFGPEVVSSPNFVFLGDDAFTGVPVGFSFEYFGDSYTNINIHSNGFLSFGATSTPTVAQFFPNPLAPNNVLAVAWDDWNPNDGGTISYATEGSAPNRKFIVDYTDLPHFGSAGALTMTTQVILYEGLNFIDYQVTRVEADAGNRTQGIENADGTEAYTSTPLTNLSNWTQDLIAYRYAPTSCGNVVTETISIDELASIGLDPTLSICSGVEGILDAGPGALSYSWSTGDTTQTITVTTPGTYSVTVLDSLGCFAGDEVVVSFSTVLFIEIDVLNATIGSSNGQALAIVTGGTPPYTYLWSDGQTTNPAFNLPAGSYEVTVTDALGCTIVGTAEVDEVSGLNGIKGLSLLEIYPNPSAGSFQVQVELSNAESVRLEIYNPLGQLVRSMGEETIMGKVWDLDLSTEAAGTYQIRIVIGDQFLSRNVVINR